MSAAALFALSNVTIGLFWALRVAAAIGAAFVGWFVTGPILRLAYRGLVRRPAPSWLMPWARLGGAALCGLLAYFFLPLGGGGGLGWGPGVGGGPGLGSGTGLAKATEQEESKQENAEVANTAPKALENLEIELIGGKRYQDDGHYYLINRREPVVTLGEVEKYLRDNADHLAEYVTIVLAPTSVDAQHGAVLRLNTVIEKVDRIPRIVNVPEKTGG